MNFSHLGGANPRQALALALMGGICAPRDGTKREGSFLTITSETAVAEPLCQLLGNCLRDRQGALIVTYASPDNDRCTGLILVRRVGGLIFCHAVDPYWPVAERRMSLVDRTGGLHRAFHVDDEDQLRELPLPGRADLTSGITAAWRHIVDRVNRGEVDPANWEMMSLRAL